MLYVKVRQQAKSQVSSMLTTTEQKNSQQQVAQFLLTVSLKQLPKSVNLIFLKWEGDLPFFHMVGLYEKEKIFVCSFSNLVLELISNDLVQ